MRHSCATVVKWARMVLKPRRSIALALVVPRPWMNVSSNSAMPTSEPSTVRLFIEFKERKERKGTHSLL